MPVLVIAVMALVIFGAIGILLFVASQMEKNTENPRPPRQHVPAARH